MPIVMPVNTTMRIPILRIRAWEAPAPMMIPRVNGTNATPAFSGP